MNVARLFVQPFDFKDSTPILPGSPLAKRLNASLQNWAGLIDWFLSHDVNVIICFGFHAGTANWPDDGRSLWGDASAQDEMVEAWRSFATMYKGRTGIIFDLLNEPHGLTAAEIVDGHALPKAVWNKLYPRIVTAIRAVDIERPIIVEPIWGDCKNFPDLIYMSDPGIIYSFHLWAPHPFTHQGNIDYPIAGTVNYPGVMQDGQYQELKFWDKSQLSVEIKDAVAFAQSHGARVMMGELGCSRGAPSADRARWVADAYSLAEQYGFDFGLLAV